MNWPRLMMGLILGKRFPRTTGDCSVRGLQGPVIIRRDRWGIPHLEVSCWADGLFGLGFCHGQDRTFQLETLLRLGRGTLSALVGKAALPVDRLARRIGFFRAAQAQWQLLPQTSQQLLQHYVHGINSAHLQGLTKLPHEFTILGSTPSPWEPADVLAYLKLQSFLLPSNWDIELARLKILLQDGPEALHDLEPGVARFPESATMDRGQTPSWLADLEAELSRFQEYARPGGGSNNWVIAGSRTTSGKPLLANDPHLPPNVPCPWYLASIRTPDGVIAGATFAGCPVFPTGHNGHGCWGITAGLTDNTDLFLETIGPDRRSVRRADGSFEPCEIVREVISVKHAPDVIEEVLITPRGPILSPFLLPDSVHLSLSAVWLKPLPIRGFLDCFQAKSFDEFRFAFAEWPALPLNLVYANSDGETGWQLVGQIPQRQGFLGMIPIPGDTPGVGWKSELVPFEQMPFVRNPPEGYIATANQRPNATSSVFLGHDFCAPFRARVITEALAGSPENWTVEECQRLQLSVRCLPWEDLRPHLLNSEPHDPDARYGWELLRQWDGQLNSNSGTATVYQLAIAELVQRVVRHRSPQAWKVALGETGSGPFSHNLFSERRQSYLVELFRETPAWLPRPLEVEFQDCLTFVIRKLRRELGPSPEWWSWGDLRPLRIQHPLFGRHKLLRRIFNLPVVPFSGDGHTVSQAGQRILEPTAPPHMIANLRAVYDTADFTNSRFALAGGQSGNPFSPHFADLFSPWREGQGVPIAFTQSEELKASQSTLRLVPRA